MRAAKFAAVSVGSHVCSEAAHEFQLRLLVQLPHAFPITPFPLPSTDTLRTPHLSCLIIHHRILLKRDTFPSATSVVVYFYLEGSRLKDVW
jgi:hypothetical protein